MQMDSTRFYRRQFPQVDEVVMVKVSVFARPPHGARLLVRRRESRGFQWREPSSQTRILRAERCSPCSGVSRRVAEGRARGIWLVVTRVFFGRS
jgi:hypothetical protein